MEIAGAKSFCDQEKTIVNPYAVSAHLARGYSVGKEKCQRELLSRAHWQSKRALESGSVRPENRDVVELGGYLYAYRMGCVAKAVGPEGSGPLLADLGKIDAANTDSNREGMDYCAAFVDPCKAMGGNKKTVKGKEVCVAAGAVWDKSCLALSPEQRNLLMAAHNSATVGGTRCLNELGGGAAVAGTQLANHFSDNDPRTQICCGDDGCQSPVFKYKKSDKDTMEYAGAIADGSGKYGTIEIPTHSIKSKLSQYGTFGGHLFHEYLHRMGMCHNPNHNDYGLNMFYREEQTGGKCAKGFSRRPIDGKLANAAGMSTDDIRRYVAKKEKVSTAGLQHVCVLESECPKGKPLIRYTPPQEHDPVYACENACFFRPDFAVMFNKDPAASNARAKEVCRGFADKGGFKGGPNTRDKGSFSGNNGKQMSGTLCDLDA
jgi:hypothetical protein